MHYNYMIIVLQTKGSLHLTRKLKYKVKILLKVT